MSRVLAVVGLLVGVLALYLSVASGLRSVETAAATCAGSVPHDEIRYSGVPYGLHGVARLNPLTFLIESGRGFIDGSPTQVAAAFSIAAAMLVFFAVWARTGLARAERAG